MAIKHIIIVLLVETPRKFITAVINLRGISTNKTIIKYSIVYIVLFVETPRKFITAKLSIRKPGSSSVPINM